jgi:hypothetical protein
VVEPVPAVFLVLVQLQLLLELQIVVVAVELVESLLVALLEVAQEFALFLTRQQVNVLQAET